MPVHKIPAASLHEDLIDINRQGEIVETCVPYGRNYFVVVTHYQKPSAMETRLGELTHAARIGAMEQRAQWDRDPLLHSFLTDDIVREDGAA